MSAGWSKVTSYCFIYITVSYCLSELTCVCLCVHFSLSVSLFLWGIPEFFIPHFNKGWRRPRHSHVRLWTSASPPPPLPISLPASVFLDLSLPVPDPLSAITLSVPFESALRAGRRLGQVGFLSERERKCSNKEHGRGCVFKNNPPI